MGAWPRKENPLICRPSILVIDMEDVHPDSRKRGVCLIRVHNSLSIGVGGSVPLARLAGISDLLDVVSHTVPVVQLLREFESLGLTLMRLVEELEYRLNGLGRQDNPGTVCKDQAISVGGNGEVGPHEVANGGFGPHRFGPRGYSCAQSLIIFVNEVDQVREMARTGEGKNHGSVDGTGDCGVCL